MARNATPWVNGAVLPDIEAGTAFWSFGSTFYPIVKNLIEQSVASGLIYLNSSARDFQNPELRPYLDTYVRGTGGMDAQQRVKLLKLLWDAIGSEFGGRGELYEINWSGSTEENRIGTLGIAQATGLADRMKDLVETCMSEYGLDGWTAPDLINPDDVSWLASR
jgi:4-hydroxyphenylacetate 3-monooxygenase